MVKNFKRFPFLLKSVTTAFIFAIVLNTITFQSAQAGLGDSIRGAVNRVMGAAKSNLTAKITSADVRGESVYISYVVENTGDADTPWGVPIDIYFYINGSRVAQDSIPLMRARSRSNKSNSVQPRFWKQENSVRIEVDSLHRIDEEDENDNEASISVNKELYTDLYINKIEFSKDTVTKGDSVTINVQIENRGNVKSNNPKIEVIINDTEKIAYTRSFSVPANGTNTAVVDFRTDSAAIKSGRNLIRAWVEPGSHEAAIEKMPLADHGVAYLEVKEKEKPKPNFVIYGSVNPKYLDQPGEISIWFNIFNKGPADSDSPLTTAVLYINNERINEFPVKSLTPWIEPVEFEYKYNIAKAGKYEIKVVVDEANRVEEIKEDDNTYIYGTLLDEYIDLEIADLGIQPNTVFKEDGYVMVTAVVLNKGSVTADSLLSIYLDNRKVFGKTFTVAPNSKESWPEQVKIEVKNAGEHKVVAEVVPYSHHEKLERNRANNKKEYNVTILPPPLPYLKLEITDFGPYRVYIGEKVRVAFRVTNAGKGSCAATFVRLLANNNVEKDLNVRALGPGDIEKFSYEAVTKQIGAYEVKVIINSEGKDVRQAGVKYDHSGFTSEVVAKPLPYLKLEFIDFGPALLYTGDKIKASFRVTNTGEGKLPSQTFIRLLINNRVEKDFVVPVLPPAGSQTFSYDKVINEPGRCDVEIRINPQGEDVRQSGVKYDKIGFSSDVKKKEKEFIDLALGDIEVNPFAPKKGEEITIKFSIGNLGSNEARGAAVIEYDGEQIYVESVYLAPHTLIGGKVVEKRFSVEKAGVYTIKAFVSLNPSYRDLEKSLENNSQEIEIVVSEGVLAEDFSKVKDVVNNLYSEFESCYSVGDVSGVLKCVSKEWESSEGVGFYELDARLRKTFSTFDRVKIEMSGFSVQPSDNPEYIAKVDYYLKIEGSLFSNPNIKHNEEGQVTEYIKKEGDKYFIGKTIGKGVF